MFNQITLTSSPMINTPRCHCKRWRREWHAYGRDHGQKPRLQSRESVRRKNASLWGCPHVVYEDYTWRKKYGGIDVPEVKRLKSLEEENASLKKLLAEAMLDKETFPVALNQN